MYIQGRGFQQVFSSELHPHKEDDCVGDKAGDGYHYPIIQHHRIAGSGVHLFSYSTDHSRHEWMAVGGQLPPTGLENGGL